MSKSTSKWHIFAIAMCGLFLFGGVSPTAHAQINTGAVSDGSGAGEPNAFMGLDVCLHNRAYSAGSWGWVNRPGPGPTPCSGGLLHPGDTFATTYALGSSRYYVAYRLVNAGLPSANLVEYDYGLTHQLTFNSQDLLGVPGFPISDVVGATTALNGTASQPYAFVLSNGELWSNHWDGTAFVWFDHTKPPGVTLTKPVGALAVVAGSAWQPYAFAVGSDGNLWALRWTGSIWTWVNHGQPAGGISTTIGTTVITSGSRPFVYVKGNDGNLWSRNYTNGVYSWFNHGKPPVTGVGIAAAMGVTCANNCSAPYAYILGTDGNLWENAYINGWTWTNHSKPAGISLGISIGATAVSFSRPYVFMMGSNGHLWSRYWSGSAWIWQDHGI